MNTDLAQVLNGAMPRGFGQLPSNMGEYERIAPSPESDALVRMIGG